MPFKLAACFDGQLGKLGWHSFRHSFATALGVVGARMKIAQELMRHSSITNTMNTCTGTVERDRRETVGRWRRRF
jgi:site-specific recombinase XerD